MLRLRTSFLPDSDLNFQIVGSTVDSRSSSNFVPNLYSMKFFAQICPKIHNRVSVCIYSTVIH
jgi:hypothetical protein